MLSDRDGCQFQLSGRSAELRSRLRRRQSGVGSSVLVMISTRMPSQSTEWRRLVPGGSEPLTWNHGNLQSRAWKAGSGPPPVPDSLSSIYIRLAPNAPVLIPDLQTPTCSSKPCIQLSRHYQSSRCSVWSFLSPSTAGARSKCLLDKSRTDLHRLCNL